MNLNKIFFYLLSFIIITPALASDLRDVKSKEFLDLLKNKEYSKCSIHFNSEMKNLMPDSILKKMWELNLTKFGESGNILSTKTKLVNGYLVYEHTISFAKKPVIYKILFEEKDTTNKIAGVFFTPTQDDNSYNLPSYINKSIFKELDTFFLSGKYKIYCTVSIPNNINKTKAVILFSGSGPNDRNGTIGKIKVYRDIAWGLATQGNVVLRFDKRTKTYGKTFNKSDIENLTINDEYLDDGVAAIDFINTFKSVDTNHIILIGHSQGGTVLSNLAELRPNIYALAHLATPSRRMEEIVPEQMEYLQQFDSSEAFEAQLNKVKKVCEFQLNTLNEGSKSENLLFGLPALYWLSLKNLNYKEQILNYKKRLFFAFGSRDFNVPYKDEQIWRDLLSGKKNVFLKNYPKLDHLFLSGEGLSNPKNYENENYVAPELIDDLNNWILEKF